MPDRYNAAMRMRNDSREFWWLAAVAVLMLSAGLGLRDPWPADEPRFVLVAKQMWESGDWLFPHRGRELYPDKPPLYFWLLCAVYALVRNWTWAFLIPSLLAALGSLWLTYDLAKRLWSPRIGFWAAIAVLATMQFIYQAKRAQIDPTVTFFITLGIYGLLRHLLLGPQWRWYWLGCFAAGLGVISKGVGFLALLILVPYLWMRWRQWPGLAALGHGNGWRWAGGAITFLLAIAIWLVSMLTTALLGDDPTHRAYLQELLFRQTATRYASAWHHQQPFWYFAMVIAFAWLPFSLALPWLSMRWREALHARDPKIWLPLTWAVLVLLFFSISSGKRDMYILPMLPAVAIAAAPYLEAIAATVRFRMLLTTMFAMAALILLLVSGVALYTEPRFEIKLESARGLDAAADHIWWLLAVTALGMAGLLFSLRRRVLLAAGAAWIWLVVALFTGAAMLLDDESSAKAVMLRARALAGAETEIGLVGWREQNLLQARGPTTEFGFLRTPAEQWNEAVIWLQQAPQTRRLFVQDNGLGDCLRRSHPEHVGTANRRRWYLVGWNAIPSECRNIASRSAQLPTTNTGR